MPTVSQEAKSPPVENHCHIISCGFYMLASTWLKYILFLRKKNVTFHKTAFQNKFILKEAGSLTRTVAKGHTGPSSESMLLVQKNPQQTKICFWGFFCFVFLTNSVVCALADRTEQWKKGIPRGSSQRDGRTQKAQKTRSKGLRR